MGCNSSPTSSVGFRQGKHTYLAEFMSGEAMVWTDKMLHETSGKSNICLVTSFSYLSQLQEDESKHPKILVTSVDKNHSLSLVEKPMEKPSIHLTSLTQKPRDFPAKNPTSSRASCAWYSSARRCKANPNSWPRDQKHSLCSKETRKKKKLGGKNNSKNLVIYCMYIYIYMAHKSHTKSPLRKKTVGITFPQIFWDHEFNHAIWWNEDHIHMITVSLVCHARLFVPFNTSGLSKLSSTWYLW